MKKNFYSSMIKYRVKAFLVILFVFLGMTMYNVDDFMYLHKHNTYDKYVDVEKCSRNIIYKLIYLNNDEVSARKAKARTNYTLNLMDITFEKVEWVDHEEYQQFALKELNQYETALANDEGFISDLADAYAKAGFTV